MRKCRPGYNGFLLKSEIAILLPPRIHALGSGKDTILNPLAADNYGSSQPPAANFASTPTFNFLALGLTQKDHQVNLIS